MAPVRIKLYGLFSMTKRRYVFQAVVAVVGTVLFLAGWSFFWPGAQGLRVRLTQPELPPSTVHSTFIAVMDAVPWILLAALAYQAAEFYLVLRLFARRAARPPAAASSPKATS